MKRNPGTRTFTPGRLAALLLMILLLAGLVSSAGATSNIAGNTGAETKFVVVATVDNAYIRLYSFKGLATVYQSGNYGRESNEANHGFYRVEVRDSRTGFSQTYMWCPSATKGNSITDETLQIDLTYIGVYNVTVTPLTDSEIGYNYWISDGFKTWVYQAIWKLNEEYGCTCRYADGSGSGQGGGSRVTQAPVVTPTPTPVPQDRNAPAQILVHCYDQYGNEIRTYSVSINRSQTLYPAEISGYTCSMNQYVFYYGSGQCSTPEIRFYYEKAIPKNAVVTVTCYDTNGKWLKSYPETISESRYLTPRAIDGYNTTSGQQYINFYNGSCYPSEVRFYYQKTPVITTPPRNNEPANDPTPYVPPVITNPPVVTNSPAVTNPPQDNPPAVNPIPDSYRKEPASVAANVVLPDAWDTQFRPGVTQKVYNEGRYERLYNVNDDDYTTSFEWLIYSSETNDDIPELTATFSGKTISSIGIRNGYLRSSYEYSRYARATEMTVKIYDSYGNCESKGITIPDGYTTDYRIYTLDRTYTDVVKIEFYLNSFRFDEYEDNGHRYVIHIADILFYQ